MNGQLMSRRQGFLCILNSIPRFVIGERNFCSTATKEPKVFDDEVDEMEESRREEELARKRNKSRLHPAHRNILNQQVPYPEPMADFHESVRYKRRLYGKYGAASGVDPRICWPDAEEFAERREWESVAQPYTLQEMIRMTSEERAAEEVAVRRREEEIANKLLKLEDWKKAFNERIIKREAEVLAAKAKKEKLVEEVRRILGYKMDPKDERFKEMLEKKEKEERKLEKVARKKAKDAKMFAKLTTITSELADSSKSQ